MNGGPYRAPQPADRRVINRSEAPSHRQPEEPQPAPKEEPPRTIVRPTTSSRTPITKKESKKGLTWTIALVVFALLVGTFGGFVWANSRRGTIDAGIDPNKYQAVYLMNGQLYFGKLVALETNHLKLTNVYYLQSGTSQDATATGNTNSADAASKFQLIKLTRAIYGPSDEMIISKDQVLYYQNLNADSKASQLIQSDK